MGIGEFADIMIRCITNKNYYGQWDPDAKSRLLSTLLCAGYDEEGGLACLKKEQKKLLPFFLRYGNADALRKLLDAGGIITEENIDRAIQTAADVGQNEITALLLEYKHRRFCYSDPAEQYRL